MMTLKFLRHISHFDDFFFLVLVENILDFLCLVNILIS